MKKVLSIILAYTLIAVILSCSSKEEKKAEFLKKGKTFYAQGDAVRAGLDLRNALQIDPNLAEAHYLLGKVEMENQRFRQAFGYFSKAVNIDPDYLDAQLELARLFLAARADFDIETD